MICDTCAGTLLVDGSPCRDCLSLPADLPGLPDLVTDALGIPDGLWPYWRPWWALRAGSPILPLWLPTARDLAARYLARRFGLDPSCGVAYAVGRGSRGPTLLLVVVDPATPEAVTVAIDADTVPALASIPADAPAELRAAAALRACILRLVADATEEA